MAVKEAVTKYEQVTRSTMIIAKVCGWVSERMAFNCLGISVGMRDPSASLECGLGPTSSPSEIGRSKGKNADVYLASKTVVLER